MPALRFASVPRFLHCMAVKVTNMPTPSIRPVDDASGGVGPEQLLVVCAWCGMELFRPAEKVLRTSHSICDSCTERVMADSALRAVPRSIR